MATGDNPPKTLARTFSISLGQRRLQMAQVAPPVNQASPTLTGGTTTHTSGPDDALYNVANTHED